jgi:hypothetical protein
LRGGLGGAGAGFVEQGVDGVGEGGQECGLVLFGPVEDLDVQDVEQVFGQGGGGVGELAGFSGSRSALFPLS